MKKLFISGLLSFLFVLAFAQPKELLSQLDKGEIEPITYAKSSATHYSKVIELSAEQQIALEKIYKKEANKLRSIAPLKSENPTLYSKKENAIFINTRQAVKLVLDRNQWRKYALHERMNKLKK